MFFTQKHKDEIEYLFNEVERLKQSNESLVQLLRIEKIRLDAVLKLYPYGANSDGSPRQKPGRKSKVQA
jgi:hypothetical protein